MPNITIESCVESLADAVYAEKHGAHQLEVCSNLDAQGLTPEIKLLSDILKSVAIPCKVMIRCRGGNFIYSDTEIKNMMAEVQKFKSFSVAGFVFGANQYSKDGIYSIDPHAIKQICGAAYPIPVTVHKAIDHCFDLLQAVKTIKTISNVKYILTSGGASTAIGGLDMLIKMQEIAAPEIQIIAAGNILPTNLPSLVENTQLHYYHGRKIV